MWMTLLALRNSIAILMASLAVVVLGFVAPGFSVRLGGQSERQREAFGSLYFTSILAIILVYMVPASHFRSLKDPLTIMFSVPMGLIGVFWALFLTDTPRSRRRRSWASS
jgi:Cu/Ag efflux pump CusA